MAEAEDIAALRVRLHALRIEHRDLDDVIERLLAAQSADEMLLRRLKKRKLWLKDRIFLLEGMIEPDIPA